MDESNGTTSGVRSVVLAHDRLDRLGCLIGVVKGDRADVVVEDMCFDDTVEQVATDETELTIDSSSGSADKVPFFGSVVGERWVGMLEEGDGNCFEAS